MIGTNVLLITFCFAKNINKVGNQTFLFESKRPIQTNWQVIISVFCMQEISSLLKFVFGEILSRQYPVAGIILLANTFILVHINERLTCEWKIIYQIICYIFSIWIRKLLSLPIGRILTIFIYKPNSSFIFIYTQILLLHKTVEYNNLFQIP